MNPMEPKRDYRSTLNLTLPDSHPGAFQQRGNLPAREPELQRMWEERQIYRKSVERNPPDRKFVLHDGPPYSNGDIHLGHALNKIAKDIVTRLKTMQGFRAAYVPGWDNHGMPIENAVARRFREEKRIPDRVELRRACRKYALQWVETQRKQFQRLGIRGEWSDPYLTMSSEFEARILEVFLELSEQGYIYRGLRPVLWCAVCETALADAEVEYEQHTSTSIYVRFAVHADPLDVFSGCAEAPEGGRTDAPQGHALIWTTTPWTIPANVALAVHPQAEYALVRGQRQENRFCYLVAAPLIESVMRVIGAQDYQVVKTLPGEALMGLVFQHPFLNRTSPVVLADYVTMDTGTGIVHTAPGHGKEDFETGHRYGLQVLCPVDAAGYYLPEAGEVDGQPLAGLRVVQPHDSKPGPSPADDAVIAAIEKRGALQAAAPLTHSYPHCWRCHSPLIFRATVQWFMNIDHSDHRRKSLDAIRQVAWHPAESINRIGSMVADRPDWCISRQRSWGVGIPAFYCGDCGEAVLQRQSIEPVLELVREKGSDAWYERPAEQILPAGAACPACGAPASRLKKETDVLDVWFDSGSTHHAVLANQVHWPDLKWPADLYLEGGDQHRGWFNSSLMTSVAMRGAAPYLSVVTNGWTLDEQGHAMHKSKGNAVDPLTVIEKYGADVLRWWVASTQFMEDTNCGENTLKQVSETYRRIRNTFRFLINNLHDFESASHSLPYSELHEIDRWALGRLRELVSAAEQAYNSYHFHVVYHGAHNFCAVDLSSIYLDVLKDRLYASGADSPERRSA
ncbi:MAG TPA: isoleucine--tRNA ligase, partial [Chthonomonadales bacterium]|nr:isoleucine--tRNA ligase [Chthonomonadales bacterium]